MKVMSSDIIVIITMYSGQRVVNKLCWCIYDWIHKYFIHVQAFMIVQDYLNLRLLNYGLKLLSSPSPPVSLTM